MLDDTNRPVFVDDRRRRELLRYASGRKLPALLASFGARGWNSWPCRFDQTPRPDEIVVLRFADDGRRFPNLAAGEQVGVTFRQGRTKCLFNSVVLPTRGDDLARPMIGLTVHLRSPDQLQQLQRRLYERVEIGATSDWPVSLSPMVTKPGVADATAKRRPVNARLHNISAGGIGVWVEPDQFVPEDTTYVCTFKPRPSMQLMTFEARIRHARREKGRPTNLGMQFVGLETTLAGHCRLAELANIVSRLRTADDH